MVPPALLAALLAGVVVVVVVLAWRLRVEYRRDRAILGLLRALVFVVLAGCLLRPALALSHAIPQRNVLAVLLDDSRSMQIPDVAHARREAAVQRVFADSTRLVRQLADRFALRFFRFAADADPLSGASALRADGTRTDLATSLATARQDLADLPLGGVVVVSDGADNGTGDLSATLAILKSKHVPVYTVGVGEERFDRDLSIDRLQLPATTLAGSGVMATVSLGVRGLSGDSASLALESDGAIVARQRVLLPQGRDVVDVPMRVPALAPGTHVIAVSVAPLPGEVVTENNETEALLRVRPGREKVLYFEGVPRSEFAFVRRALDGDSALQLVGLLRSAKDKYLRLDVDDSLDLLGGFPTRRDELFKYRAVILGDIEASAFTGAQLRMLADFVDKRGGALLALGGRSTLAEGGFSGTPVADALPFTLPPPRAGDTAMLTLTARPTAVGLLHPALQLGATMSEDTARWDSLPAVTTVNRLGSLRAGATELLAGRVGSRGADLPVLAVERYGRGVSAVLGIEDTWLWKMDPTAPVANRSFETFWRQMIRWALDQVPDRLEITPVPARVGPGEAVTIQARAVDSAYTDMNDATVVARVMAPSGTETDVPLDWTLRDDGTYAGQFVPTELGTYRLSAYAARGADTTRSAQGGILVDLRGADMDHPELRTALLKRIAEETGGRYYALADLSQLPDDVVLTESGIVAHETRDLWDMPVVVLLLIALLAAEWIYRRRRGLA